MKISTRMIGNVAVVSLSGKLMGGPPTSDDIKNEIYRLLDQGVKKIVMDLEKVTRMNSTGLGILISCLTSVKNREGEFCLAAINENMQSIMVMTKLNTIFQIYATAEGAAKALETNS